MNDKVVVVSWTGHYSEFMLEDAPGFWELRGYHMYGDPWKEQRFWDDDMKVWEIRKRGKQK